MAAGQASSASSPLVVCGKLVPLELHALRKTCSDPCRLERHRESSYRSANEKYQSDPVYRAKWQKYRREWQRNLTGEARHRRDRLHRRWMRAYSKKKSGSRPRGTSTGRGKAKRR